MQVALKAICDRRTRKDGTNVIAIQYWKKEPFFQSIFTCLFVIGIGSKEKSLKKLPISFGDADGLNQHLREMSRRA